MLATYTMQEIQREFLFVRADVEELERTLERVFLALSNAAKQTTTDGVLTRSQARNGPVLLARDSRVVTRELSDARAVAADLVAKLTSVETRLTMQARLQREAV